MAVTYFDSSLNVPDFTADQDERTASVSSGSEINLGAFRGLAIALILETTLVALGGLVWHLLRMLF
jgi:hypothetical protein